jgi:hypothetical protein
MVDALYLPATRPPARRKQGLSDASCPTDQVTRWHDLDDDFAHREYGAGCSAWNIAASADQLTHCITTGLGYRRPRGASIRGRKWGA